MRDFSSVHWDGRCFCKGKYCFSIPPILRYISTFKASLSLCRFEPVMVHCYLCGWLYVRVVCRDSRETYDIFLISPATLHWVVTRLLLHKSQLFPLIMIKPLDVASYYGTVHLLSKPFVKALREIIYLTRASLLAIHIQVHLILKHFHVFLLRPPSSTQQHKTNDTSNQKNFFQHDVSIS